MYHGAAEQLLGERRSRPGRLMPSGQDDQGVPPTAPNIIEKSAAMINSKARNDSFISVNFSLQRSLARMAARSGLGRSS